MRQKAYNQAVVAALDQKYTQEKPSLTKASTGNLLRSYLKTILANPESRKIFYFLILNMWFMVIQMLYGVWTNSLGLISDGMWCPLPFSFYLLMDRWPAIHMAFDCMAIAVGLIASVMATWPANERFTYGYGRIETLSGFANGIFLILISIFIVFEAIQRMFVVLCPPFKLLGSLTLSQPRSSGNEYQPAVAHQFSWFGCKLVWYVRYGWTPPPRTYGVLAR
jgi:divalent metal cation (Fe/Co/Zn/Cd) transporter